MCSNNGCLQIIPGSHHLGRLNHGRSGDLASIDVERMEAVMARLGGPVLAETEPGDVLFFHRFHELFDFLKYLFNCSNLLHTSGPNTSTQKRWNLVLAYNQVNLEILYDIGICFFLD